MCGKLEEFPENRRILYFPSFSNTSFIVNAHPKFKFAYKLVDNCYNITFLERNGTFMIESTELPLKCHFKIHLPFGNRIKLKLHLEGDDGHADIEESRKEIKKSSAGKFNYSDLKLDDFSSDVTLPSQPSNCNGILVEIANRLNEKYEHCINFFSENSEHALTSSDNVLLIQLTKHSTSLFKDTQKFKTKMKRIITLEYSAEPIETIVSSCAFGWILAGRFCLSTFNELLSWQEAENYCIILNGHLASIHSENEQKLIDAMLLNR